LLFTNREAKNKPISLELLSTLNTVILSILAVFSGTIRKKKGH